MKMPQKPRDIKDIMKENVEIMKLFNNKTILEFATKHNRDHTHWDRLRYLPMPNDANPEQVWALMKLFRKSQYRMLDFGSWKFRYVLLDEFQKKLHLLDMGTAGRLGSSLENVNIAGKQRYIISSLMEEAIASSQLEGAATTRKVAKEMLRTKKKPRNYSEQMIANGYRTIQKIAQMKEKTLTTELILELHGDITEGTLKDPSYEGRFRDNNEVVVGDPLAAEKVYHIPPDYKEVPKLMEQLCAFANSDSEEFIHPIIKAIIIHFLIGYIHPFEDGNGRTARTLFYWYVLREGYWLFEFMAISRIILRSKTKYGLAYLYTETDENDLTYFIDYNLSAIEEALHDTEEYVDRKQKGQTEALRLIKSIKGINLRQAEILKEFIRDPDKTFAIIEIMGTYGVVYQTARNDLLDLSALGYLEKIKVEKKFLFKLAKNKILPE